MNNTYILLAPLPVIAQYFSDKKVPLVNAFVLGNLFERCLINHILPKLQFAYILVADSMDLP